MNDRLYRSRDDRVIAGVAGGLAERLDIDPSIVRVLWVILAVLTGGVLALVYLVMMVVVPEEPFEINASAWRAGSASPPGPPPEAGTGAPSDSASTVGGQAVPGPQPGSAGPAGASGWQAPGIGTGSWTPPGPSSRDWRAARAADRAARRAERLARQADRRAHGDRAGGLVFGLILILVGGWFLVRAYLPEIDTDRLWPIGLIVIGAVLLLASVRRDRSTPTG